MAISIGRSAGSSSPTTSTKARSLESVKSGWRWAATGVTEDAPAIARLELSALGRAVTAFTATSSGGRVATTDTATGRVAVARSSVPAVSGGAASSGSGAGGGGSSLTHSGLSAPAYQWENPFGPLPLLPAAPTGPAGSSSVSPASSAPASSGDRPAWWVLLGLAVSVVALLKGNG